MSTILSTLSVYFIFVIFFSYILHSFAVFWFQCISDAINMIDQDIIIFVYIFTILSFVKIIYVITPKVSNVFKRIFLCKNSINKKNEPFFYKFLILLACFLFFKELKQFQSSYPLYAVWVQKISELPYTLDLVFFSKFMIVNPFVLLCSFLIPLVILMFIFIGILYLVLSIINPMNKEEVNFLVTSTKYIIFSIAAYIMLFFVSLILLYTEPENYIITFNSFFMKSFSFHSFVLLPISLSLGIEPLYHMMFTIWTFFGFSVNNISIYGLDPFFTNLHNFYVVYSTKVISVFVSGINSVCDEFYNILDINESTFINFDLFDFLSSNFYVSFFVLLVLFFALCLFQCLKVLLCNNVKAIEFYFIFFFCNIFLVLVIFCTNLFHFYLFVEGIGLCSYVLLITNVKHFGSTESSVKYLFLGSFASGLLLFGLILLYSFIGSLSFFSIRWFSLSFFNFYSFFDLLLYKYSFTLLFSIFFLLCGILFKISAFPFHIWTPDVYSGAFLGITVFFSFNLKLVYFCFLLRLLFFTFFYLHFIWKPLFLISSYGSIILGCLGALKQRHLKRFIAYTSINQVGFFLAGLCCVGNIDTFYILFFYLLVFLITNWALYLFIFSFFSCDKLKIVWFSDLSILSSSNLNKRFYFFPYMFGLIIFSFGGLPPLAGFWSKYYLLCLLFYVGDLVLLCIILLTSILSIYNSIRIVKIIWFESHDKSELLYTSSNISFSIPQCPITFIVCPIFASFLFLVNLFLVVYLNKIWNFIFLFELPLFKLNIKSIFLDAMEADNKSKLNKY